jgi:peptide/nickel transport system permease protein
MKIKDISRALREFWAEFRKSTSGLIGLGILVISLLVVLFEPVILPWKDANTRWRDIDYWIDNSAGAPPAWTNLFVREKRAVTTRIESPKREEADMDGGGKIVTLTFPYNFTADKAPLDLIFRATITGDIPLTLSVQRPDGKSIDLASHFEQGLSNQGVRITVNNEAGDSTFAFVKEFVSEEGVSALSSDSAKPVNILFSKADATMVEKFEPLKGSYDIVVTAMLLDPASARIDKPYIAISGSVSGILGTDDMKRDIFSGLVAGLKWALLIGLLTSAIAVLVGVLYGITSAYYGGIVDSTMQFVYQIWSSLPVLPVLIVVSAIYKPSLWSIVGVMVLFFWTGSVMTVRSMALQIKEETYIEAAKALGSNNRRIIFRHMLPILIPYSFASMALSVPSAIVYESTVSLLGLGDATKVTWGQILHDAMVGGAVLNGVWWWIIPPGLLIAITGMTFAFLGFAMDKILHPKLQTR